MNAPPLVLQSMPGQMNAPMRIVIAPDQRAILGRADTGAGTAHFEFPHGTVSTKHAEVWYEAGTWWIRDTHSSAGIWVDEATIGYGGTVPIRAGQLVRLGGLNFTVEEARPGEPPTLAKLPPVRP